MISIVLRALSHVQRGDCVRHEVYIDNVHTIARTQREDRQSCQENERPHHIELSSFCAAAVTENNAGTENGFRHIRQELANHVLAKFFGARIGIVIRAVPVDGIIFSDDLALTLPGHGYRAHVTEAAEAVVVVHLHSQPDYFEGSAQVHVQAALF